MLHPHHSQLAHSLLWVLLQFLQIVGTNTAYVKIITELPDYKKLEFLNLLKEIGFKIYEINTTTKQLEFINSPEEFIEKTKGVDREIRYLFCEK